MFENFFPSLRHQERVSAQTKPTEERASRSLFGEVMSGLPDSLVAPVEISESDSAVHVRMELPGMDPGKIDVHVEKGRLVVSGEKSEATSSEKKSYHHREIRYGSFRRSFRLPTEVDGSASSAVFKDGVLSIDLPKRAEALAKKITVS